MTEKTHIDQTDADFDQFDVFIHGELQRNVVSADTTTGEVWRYQIDGEGQRLPKRKLYETRLVEVPPPEGAPEGTEPTTDEERVEVGEEPDFPKELASGTVTIVAKNAAPAV